MMLFSSSALFLNGAHILVHLKGLFMRITIFFFPPFTGGLNSPT